MNTKDDCHSRLRSLSACGSLAIQSPPPPPSDKRTDDGAGGWTDGPTEGFLRLRERVYASGCGKERHGANGMPAGAVNDFHYILSAKETSSNGNCALKKILHRKCRAALVLSVTFTGWKWCTSRVCNKCILLPSPSAAALIFSS